MKRPLVNTAVMDIQTEGEEETAFIVRYNQVINAYNKYAEEGSPKMEVMVGNGFIKKISEYLSRPLFIVIIALVMLLLPIVNIVCLGCMIAYLLCLWRENKKHLRNINRVNDPFENFYFVPEMCESMGKHHVILNLEQSRTLYPNQKSKALLSIKNYVQVCRKN
jgi:hypothetical protein